MSLDTTPEEKAILALLSQACSGRVFDMIADETVLVKDTTTGLVLPYLLVTFGEIFPFDQDHSLEGAAEQPHVLPFVVECWGATLNQARGGAIAVRKLLTGKHPTPDNSSEITLGGGGRFTSRDPLGRPVRFCRTVTASCLVNMSIHDDAP